MSLATAVMIGVSSVRSSAGREGQLAVRRQAEVGDDVHRVGRRAAVAEGEQPAAGVEAPAADRRGRRRQRVGALAQRLLAQLADLLRLHQRRGLDVGEHRVEVVLALGEERVEEARGAGVVGRAGAAALEQAAMVEEDVDQLPEHVVERLDELLADRRLGARAARTPSAIIAGGIRRAGPKPIVMQPRSAAARRPAAASLAAGSGPPSPKPITMSSAAGDAGELRSQRPALAGQRDRGQRPLADDHRVDELDRDVAGVGAGGRIGPERDQPAVAGEALRHPVTAAGDRRRLAAGRRPIRRRGGRRSRARSAWLPRPRPLALATVIPRSG